MIFDKFDSFLKVTNRASHSKLLHQPSQEVIKDFATHPLHVSLIKLDIEPGVLERDEDAVERDGHVAADFVDGDSGTTCVRERRDWSAGDLNEIDRTLELQVNPLLLLINFQV